MRRDHSKLAPVLFDFIPKGRTKTDAALYKLMRHQARLNRQQNYDTIRNALRDLMLYGEARIKTRWKSGA